MRTIKPKICGKSIHANRNIIIMSDPTCLFYMYLEANSILLYFMSPLVYIVVWIKMGNFAKSFEGIYSMKIKTLTSVDYFSSHKVKCVRSKSKSFFIWIEQIDHGTTVVIYRDESYYRKTKKNKKNILENFSPFADGVPLKIF